jgi:hypothetical protein
MWFCFSPAQNLMVQRRPAGMDAGVNNFLGLQSKPKAQNRQGAQ